MARRGRFVAAGVGLAAVGMLAWAQLVNAASDANAVAIKSGLQSFGAKADQLASDPTLRQLVALTGYNPVGPQGLDLDSAVGDVMDAIPAAPSSLADLEGDLEGLDGPYGGVTATVGCPPTPLAAGCTPVEITETAPFVVTLPLKLTHTENVPVALDTSTIDVGGGELAVTTVLNTTLSFRLDPSVPTPALAFSVAPATANIDVDVNEPAGFSVTTNFGFTQATVTEGAEDLAVRLDLDVALNDPDSSGRILQDEWASTAIADLITVTKGGYVAGTLDVDTTLTATNPDVNELSVADTNLTNGYTPPVGPSLGSLGDFANINGEQAVAGLGQVAAGLAGIKSAGDPKLPFLQDGLGKTLDAAAPLLNLVNAMAVHCGTADANPPTGDVGSLASGTRVYCQAKVSETPDAGSLNWTATSGTSLSTNTGGEANDTVGPSPTVRFSFTTGAAGAPDVKATYTVGGASRTIVRPSATAQKLFAELKDRAGFQDEAGEEVQYDPATKALTFRLKRTFNPSPTPAGGDGSTTFDFGDQLKEVAGLIGLNPTGTASVIVDAGTVTLDLTFGIVLTPTAAAVEPGDNADPLFPPGDVDRFFLKVGAGKELAYEGLTITPTVNLKGQIGYLEVAATGSTTAPGAGGEIFSITKPIAGQPLVGVDVSATGVGVDADNNGSVVAGETISDAILVRKLLNDLNARVTPTVNAGFKAGLQVSASFAGSPTPLATGKVGINWPDVTSPLVAANIQADSDFNADLEVFRDINPTNPQALLSLILDNLDSISTAVEGIAGNSFNARIPFVGASPKEIVSQFQQVKAATDELRGATPGDIVCGTVNANPPTMPDKQSLDALIFATPTTEVTVYCQSVNPKPASKVAWSVTNAAPVEPPADANATAVASVGPSPTVSFAFKVTNKQLASEENAGGWKVNLAFTDEDGPHDADLPDISVPTTLQKLEDAIEDKLGIPEGALTLAVKEFSGQKNLVVRLNFSQCTSGNAVIGACTAADKQVAKTKVPLAFDLGGPVGGMLDANSSTFLDLEYIARAKLNLAIPLSASPVPTILDSSGVDLQAGLSSDNLNLNAAIGPLTIKLGTDVNTDADPEPEGTGKLRLGAAFALANSNDGDAWTPDTEAQETPIAIGSYAGGIQAKLSNPPIAPTGGSCGTIDPNYDGDISDAQDLNGAAGCLKVSASLGSTYLKDIGIKLNNVDLTASGAVDIFTPPDLAAQIGAALLDWDLLLQALPDLLEKLEGTLDGTASGVKIPLLGDALDGGADVVNKLRTGVVEPLTGLAAQIQAAGDVEPAGALDGDTDALDVREKIQQVLFGALDGANLLQPGLDNEEIAVTMECNGGPACVNGNTPQSISDVRVTFTIGQGGVPGVGCSTPDCATGASIPFDIGLDGLPVRLTGSLAPKVGWRANLDFGLSRTDGPYLVTGGAGHQPGPELQVGASVGLGAAPSCPPQDVDATTPGLTGFSTTRCLDGTLGFLGVTVWDKDSAPSGVGIKATLDLTGPNRIKLLDIPSQLGASFAIEGGATVDALVRTGPKLGEQHGLPALLGTLHVGWTWGAGSAPTAGALNVSFDNLYLDAGEFTEELLGPIANEIKNLTAPFKPFVDTLQSEIPVVSDLAKLVGADPIKLIDLMEAASDTNLDVVKSVIAFLDFANNIPSDTGLIPLGGLVGGNRTPGSFSLVEDKAKAGPVTPDATSQLIKPGANAGGGLINEIAGNDDPAPAMKEPGRPSTFGVPGLSFPIMDDLDGRAASAKVFNVLMGGDETLVRYDLGRMDATAGFSYSFGPFFIGPVPVTANIGGSATIRGQFAFGYDTSGLRKVLEGGSGEHLFDGLFLDDLNAQGIDVAEVEFVGEVYAGASVNILIFEAGLEGGIRLTVGLNLDDSPDPDGKLHIEEIVNKLNNPICLFEVEGRLELFLRAFLEVDLFLFSERVEFEFLNILLLDFSAACTPPEPILAVKSGNTLTLNIGNEVRRKARQVNIDEVNEKVTVRPVAAGVYSVSMFGEYQEFGSASEPITTIVANADAGDDSISLLPGGEAVVGDKAGGGVEVKAPTELPFTATAIINGGNGHDAITTGDGNDTINGNDGNDKINAGAGNDLVNGGGDNDSIDGGFGDDRRGLNGDGGSDGVNGGPGGDNIKGGTGNDVLNGGPSSEAPPAAGNPDPSDGEDLIIGEGGSDSINGNDGDDELHGGNDILPAKNEAGILAACASASGPAFDNSSPDQDQIQAGPGNDWVTGGPDKDQLIGAEGHDRLCGNDGNDRLEGDSPSPGNDFLDGGPANDVLLGFAGDDVLRGGAGNDNLEGAEGNDDLIGGTGRDRLNGGAGRDIALGDNGTISNHTTLVDHAGVTHDGLTVRAKPTIVGPDVASSGNGGSGRSCAYNQTDVTADDADCVFGGADPDFLFGERGADQVQGDDGQDYVEGNADNDLMRGGLLDDTMFGNPGDDEMYGDSGDDDMFGNDGCDNIRGNQGNDDMEGNGSADTMYGDAGQDNMVGGSSAAGAEDDEADCDGGGPLPTTGDTMYGNAGTDAMAGDNATITGVGTVDTEDDPTEGRSVTLHDVDSANVALGGPDTMEGNEANDLMFGQAENDAMSGGAGVDRMQGNADTDTMNGDVGADLMLGGSDATAGSTASTDDTGDVMNGDGGDDVMVGDNGDILWTKVVAPPDGTDAASFGNDEMNGNAGKDQMFGELGDDDMNGDAGTDFMLGDRGIITQAATAALLLPGGSPQHSVVLSAPETGGEDDMYGNGADDHMYGGWAGDTMEGGPADDYMEGNGGRDDMYGLADSPIADAGEGDEDDMLGGSSPAVNPDEPRKDEGETVMEGNLEQDVMTGDNATITREVNPADATLWAVDNITGGAKRIVTLLDREKVPGTSLTAVGGGDIMLGNEGNDRMYGEGGDDCMKGNEQDDYLEGNQDSDFMEGNAGEDDLIGGSSFEVGAAGSGVGDPDAADDIYGGGDADVIMGDNAIVTRNPAVPGGPYDWTTVAFNWLAPDVDRYIDFLDLGDLAPAKFGGDTLSGGQEEDVLFGQDGRDSIFGGTEDDYMEGNGSVDSMYGDRDATPDAAETCDSPPADLHGPAGTAGQDDQIGGSSLDLGNNTTGDTGHRDGGEDTDDLPTTPPVGDHIQGDGNADFQLGDNGRLVRPVAANAYKKFVKANAETIIRVATRFDVGSGIAAGTAGGDRMYGDHSDATVVGTPGDDYQWGQDGNDIQRGGPENDDMYGELGDDRMFGEAGEDAMLGDRGGIADWRVNDVNGTRQAGDPASFTLSITQPPAINFVAFRDGMLDRRFDLLRDPAPESLTFGAGFVAATLPMNSLTDGGADFMRGGADHDSMHGGKGDDLMNGDSGGDILFGADGKDAMWGGKGCDPVDGAPDCTALSSRGENDRYVDILFGGRGGEGTGTNKDGSGADFLDYRPRPGPTPADPAAGSLDPASWFEITDTANADVADNQHHQGIDWIYGGWDRDVMQGDVAANGPNPGDRLLDWTGAYNLYTHCNAAYGGFNDVREFSPDWQLFLRRMAYALGAGPTQEGVDTSTKSGYRELALVYTKDVKANSGPALSTTPGHFENFSCAP